jgi:hypothetical protein
MEKFGGMLQMQDMECKVIGEFVLVSFEPDIPGAYRHIKEDSGLVTNTITKLAWAKAPRWWKPSQLVAHLMIMFNSPENAKHAIRNGLYITGKKINIHILVQDVSDESNYGLGRDSNANTLEVEGTSSEVEVVLD